MVKQDNRHPEDPSVPLDTWYKCKDKPLTYRTDNGKNPLILQIEGSQYTLLSENGSALYSGGRVRYDGDCDELEKICLRQFKWNDVDSRHHEALKNMLEAIRSRFDLKNLDLDHWI